MIITSFYTPNYRTDALKLIETCEELGLKHHVEQIPDTGDWRKNCGYKPEFLLKMLDYFKQPVVWVDADARIKVDPCLAYADWERPHDFAAWFIPNKHMRPRDLPAKGADGIASGTMIFYPTSAAYGLLMLWEAMNIIDLMSSPRVEYEQIVLGRAWLKYQKHDTGLQTLRLPQRYCKVFDSPWFEGEDGPTVIEHTQASRRLRKKCVKD